MDDRELRYHTLNFILCTQEHWKAKSKLRNIDGAISNLGERLLTELKAREVLEATEEQADLKLGLSPATKEKRMDDRQLREKVMVLIGAASTCWKGGTGDSEFESDRAVALGEEFIAELKASPYPPASGPPPAREVREATEEPTGLDRLEGRGNTSSAWGHE